MLAFNAIENYVYPDHARIDRKRNLLSVASNISLIIGTRGSPLALAQTELLIVALSSTHKQFEKAYSVETSIIKTSGDKTRYQVLADIGGKGMFTKEIDEALLSGKIDLAVHSLKDVPTQIPHELEIICVLERENPCDALIGNGLSNISALPNGSRVGTSSPRRRAQLLYLRPDLKVIPIRGNVMTRINKLTTGEYDATLLAFAGLRRLDRTQHISAVLAPEDMLPAAAQGAIGIICRNGDNQVFELLDSINHPVSAQCVAAERSLLATLGGSCNTPIAALAEQTNNGDMRLRAMIADPNGLKLFSTERIGSFNDAKRIGKDAGEELYLRGGKDIISN